MVESLFEMVFGIGGLLLFLLKFLLGGIVIFSPFLIPLCVWYTLEYMAIVKDEAIRQELGGDYLKKTYDNYYNRVDVIQGNQYFKKNKIAYVFSFVTGLLAVIMFINVSFYELSNVKTETKVIEKDIVQMKDNQGFYFHGTRRHTEGSDIPVYYYIEDNNGSYQQKRLDASDCKIVQGDFEKAYVSYYCDIQDGISGKWHEKIIRWLFPYNEPTSYGITRATFHIPVGTIEETFEIDGE